MVCAVRAARVVCRVVAWDRMCLRVGTLLCVFAGVCRGVPAYAVCDAVYAVSRGAALSLPVPTRPRPP